MSTPTIYGILTVRAAGGQDEIPILQPLLELGRSRDSDVLLEDRGVSRRHARLRALPRGWEIQDQGSENGTAVDGQPLPRRRPSPLQPGAVVEIGAFELLVRPGTDGVPPPSLGEKVRIEAEPKPGLAIYEDGTLLKLQLMGSVVTLGRGSDNDVVLSSAMVSRQHARVEWTGKAFRIVDLDSTHGLLHEGQRVSHKELEDGDVVRIGDQVTIQFRAFIGFLPVKRAKPEILTQRLPTGQEPLRIGRAPDNQIVLDHPQISRYHALVERMGAGRYRLRDLKSMNGVFVNNKGVDEAWLRPGDEIQIGPFRLRMQEEGIGQLPDAGLRVDAIRLQQWVTREKNLLQDISLSIYPQELVALVGLSGAGKTTLMNALSGFWPVSHGTVRVNGVNLYRSFDLFRNELGYVPQQDIVHTELTVHEALDYAARLRMPADTSPAERRHRIREVLRDLDLAAQQHQAIQKLSGGQLKRVSIGVELLTKPRLFFLDEPTSGLDPGTEYGMMKLMRRLADQGRTIVLITHATKNVMLCDKVVFIVRGGYVAYYGPPEAALDYFNRYRTAQERREKDMEFDNIYIILEDRARGTPKRWAERYRRSPAYNEYVVDRIREGKQATRPRGLSATAVARRLFAGSGRRISAWRQLGILSARNLRILTRDRLSLLLMLLVPLLVGSFGFIWSRDLLDPVTGDAAKVLTLLFSDGLITILIGSISAVLQIVRENDIYKRERIVGLRIGPYVLSKVWIGVVLALYQALVIMACRLVFVDLKLPGAGAYLAVYVTLVLGVLSGYLMGLAISAGAPNLNVAMLLVIVVLIPQFLFAGVLLPLELIPGGDIISTAASTRWAFEGLVNITTMGDELVADPCWDDRAKHDVGTELGWNTILGQSDEEKRAAGCLCMGSAIFETCRAFPGILGPDFYDAEVQAALADTEPTQPPTPTPYPTLTPYPKPSSSRQMDAYMQRLEAQGQTYQDLRQQQGDEYQEQMVAFGDQKADWERQREGAIRGAEGMLKSVFQDYGQAFKGKVGPRWATMGVIMAVLLVVIVILQKRKDNV
jgi:ABC-type multidrug transport system ATPase subunit/pSer/pThr/pTyr-binding forkhead associated (FHA) protein